MGLEDGGVEVAAGQEPQRRPGPGLVEEGGQRVLAPGAGGEEVARDHGGLGGALHRLAREHGDAAGERHGHLGAEGEDDGLPLGAKDPGVEALERLAAQRVAAGGAQLALEMAEKRGPDPAPLGRGEHGQRLLPQRPRAPDGEGRKEEDRQDPAEGAAKAARGGTLARDRPADLLDGRHHGVVLDLQRLGAVLVGAEQGGGLAGIEPDHGRKRPVGERQARPVRQHQRGVAEGHHDLAPSLLGRGAP
jgi:hypothetical protein